ncbi:hypothetical protein [Mycobacteroides abscessus]|uniref:hypothetical protein n=1 Tax=Mycobacteroides abscessus TaxID=36809 RepID=UPI000C26A0A4|nr:hypothetical protein [Mycobacteroides abscessus]
MSARQVVIEALIESFDPADLPSLHKISALASELLDALKANGYAVVELPEPDVVSSINNQHVSEWHPGYETISVYTHGEIEASWGLDSDEATVASLREIAGACLAAAAAAERDSEER